MLGFLFVSMFLKGFVSEVPHCSRDLELTEQRLHSFRWDKTQSWVVWRASFFWGGEEEAATPVCVQGGRVVSRRRRRRWKGQGGSEGRPPALLWFCKPCARNQPLPWAQKRPSASCGSPMEKDLCQTGVFQLCLYKNHFAHIVYEPHCPHRTRAL